MASRNLMSAILVTMTTIGALYIFMITFGGAMDGFYYTFTNLTPTLGLSSAWTAQADKTLTYWRLFYGSVTAIMIAMGVWIIRITFMDQDYTRQG